MPTPNDSAAQRRRERRAVQAGVRAIHAGRASFGDALALEDRPRSGDDLPEQGFSREHPLRARRAV